MVMENVGSTVLTASARDQGGGEGEGGIDQLANWGTFEISQSLNFEHVFQRFLIPSEVGKKAGWYLDVLNNMVKKFLTAQIFVFFLFFFLAQMKGRRERERERKRSSFPFLLLSLSPPPDFFFALKSAFFAFIQERGGEKKLHQQPQKLLFLWPLVQFFFHRPLIQANIRETAEL